MATISSSGTWSVTNLPTAQRVDGSTGTTNTSIPTVPASYDAAARLHAGQVGMQELVQFLAAAQAGFVTAGVTLPVRSVAEHFYVLLGDYLAKPAMGAADRSISYGA